MVSIKSQLLNGAKASVDEYINHWSKNTGEICSLTAEVEGDQVRFIISTRCVNTHDWDAHDFGKCFDVGTCDVSDKVVSNILLHENQQKFVLRLSLAEERNKINIEVKHERSHWMSLTGHYQSDLYQMVKFTPLYRKFVDRPEDFFIQPKFQPIPKTHNITEEQYEMLTRLNKPLEDRKLRDDVKHILLNGVASDDKEAAKRESDFMKLLTINDSVADFRILKRRLEWLNGWYAHQGPNNTNERIDVILPTFGWKACSREQNIIESVSRFKDSMTIEQIAKMYRRDLTEVRNVLTTYNRALKVIHEIRPLFFTNISLDWNT